MFTNGCACTESELAARFAVSEMLLLQVVHGCICMLLIELALVGHATFISIINDLFKALGMGKIGALVLMLQGNSTSLVVEVPILWNMLR